MALWQDKAPQGRGLESSVEPYTAMIYSEDRPKHHGSEKRQTVHASTRIRKPTHTELARLADEHGWTVSKEIALAIHEHIEGDYGDKFGARMRAIITDAVKTAIDTEFKSIRAMLAKALENTEEEKFILEGVVSPEQLAAAKKLTDKSMRR